MKRLTAAFEAHIGRLSWRERELRSDSGLWVLISQRLERSVGGRLSHLSCHSAAKPPFRESRLLSVCSRALCRLLRCQVIRAKGKRRSPFFQCGEGLNASARVYKTGAVCQTTTLVSCSSSKVNQNVESGKCILCAFHSPDSKCTFQMQVIILAVVAVALAQTTPPIPIVRQSMENANGNFKTR